MDNLYVTGGADENDNDDTHYFVTYDPKTAHLTRLKDMLLARSHHSCVVFAGKIVVTGGLPWIETRGSVEAYDYFENKWSYMPDLIKGRDGHGSVAMGNKLYVIGGINTRNSEVFDYISKKFTLIKPMPLNYEYDDFVDNKFLSFRVKDKVIVKYDTKDKDKNNIYIYDTKEDKWSSMCVEYFKENKGQLMYS